MSGGGPAGARDAARGVPALVALVLLHLAARLLRRVFDLP